MSRVCRLCTAAWVTLALVVTAWAAAPAEVRRRPGRGGDLKGRVVYPSHEPVRGITVRQYFLDINNPPPQGRAAPAAADDRPDDPGNRNPGQDDPAAGAAGSDKVVITTTTNRHGEFAFKNLPVGRYGVAARARTRVIADHTAPVHLVLRRVRG